jgi:P-type E1-E2 ATPase
MRFVSVSSCAYVTARSHAQARMLHDDVPRLDASWQCRYKADKQANATPVKLFRAGRFQEVESWSLLVGDVIKVHKDEEFPADMVVVSTSEEGGTLYVETSNLDGERTLKRLYALVPAPELNPLHHAKSAARSTRAEISEGLRR